MKGRKGERKRGVRWKGSAGMRGESMDEKGKKGDARGGESDRVMM